MHSGIPGIALHLDGFAMRYFFGQPPKFIFTPRRPFFHSPSVACIEIHKVFLLPATNDLLKNCSAILQR